MLILIVIEFFCCSNGFFSLDGDIFAAVLHQWTDILTLNWLPQNNQRQLNMTKN